MSRIEKLSKAIASIISKNLSIDEDHEEVIAYGAFALLQTTVSIMVVVVFGVIFNVLVEAIIISFSAATLRKFSGGAHATQPMSCALIGMIIFGGLALLVKNYIIKIDLIYLIFILITKFVFVFFIIIKYSPVGSVNKPLKKETTRSRLKKQSLNCVFILLILNITLMTLYLNTQNTILLSAAVCVSTGIAWQSITLVSLGRLIIEKFDKVLGGTSI